MVLRDAPGTSDDLLQWKVSRGAQTTPSAFGDPIDSGTTVLLCLYDSANAPQPVISAVVPPGGLCDAKPCWKLRGSRGYRYRSRPGDADGVVLLKLRTSAAGEARLLVKGRGAKLAMPARDLALPVLAQLVVGDENAAACWSAVFENASRNDGGQFRASSP